MPMTIDSTVISRVLPTPLRIAVVEEVVGDGAPVDRSPLAKALTSSAEQRDDDDGRDVAAVVPDRDGLDGLRCRPGGGASAGPVLSMSTVTGVAFQRSAEVAERRLSVAAVDLWPSLTAPSSTPHFVEDLVVLAVLDDRVERGLEGVAQLGVAPWRPRCRTGPASTCSPTTSKSLPPPEVFTAYAATGKSLRAASAPPARSRVWASGRCRTASMAIAFLPSLVHFFDWALARSCETVPRCTAIFLPQRSSPGLDPLVVALLGVDRDAGGEVVDEVDALADLLARVVDALLAVLGVRHRGHGDVVAPELQAGDQGVEGAVLELELHAELLAHARRRGRGRCPTILPPSLNSTGAYAMSEPTLMTPVSWIVLGQLVEQRAPWRRGVVELAAGRLSVWSPQPVSSRAPATAIAPTAAIRDLRGGRTTGGACGHAGFLRRVREYADGSGHTSSSVATSCDYGILPFGLAPFRGPAMSKSDNGRPPTSGGLIRKAELLPAADCPECVRPGTRAISASGLRARMALRAVRALVAVIQSDDVVQPSVDEWTRPGRALRPVERCVTPLIRGSGRVCGAPGVRTSPRAAGQPPRRARTRCPPAPQPGSGHPQHD